MLDDLGLRMGVADVRCENRTPVADVVLDRVPDGESRSFTVKVGDTVAFDQYELFVSQASCGWDGSGSASLVVLVKA